MIRKMNDSAFFIVHRTVAYVLNLLFILNEWHITLVEWMAYNFGRTRMISLMTILYNYFSVLFRIYDYIQSRHWYEPSKSRDRDISSPYISNCKSDTSLMGLFRHEGKILMWWLRWVWCFGYAHFPKNFMEGKQNCIPQTWSVQGLSVISTHWNARCCTGIRLYLLKLVALLLRTKLN